MRKKEHRAALILADLGVSDTIGLSRWRQERLLVCHAVLPIWPPRARKKTRPVRILRVRAGERKVENPSAQVPLYWRPIRAIASPPRYYRAEERFGARPATTSSLARVLNNDSPRSRNLELQEPPRAVSIVPDSILISRVFGKLPGHSCIMHGNT